MRPSQKSTTGTASLSIHDPSFSDDSLASAFWALSITHDITSPPLMPAASDPHHPIALAMTASDRRAGVIARRILRGSTFPPGTTIASLVSLPYVHTDAVAACDVAAVADVMYPPCVNRQWGLHSRLVVRGFESVSIPLRPMGLCALPCVMSPLPRVCVSAPDMVLGDTHRHATPRGFTAQPPDPGG